MPVLKSGMRSGRIFTWCREQNIALSPTADERRVLHTSITDHDELARVNDRERVGDPAPAVG